MNEAYYDDNWYATFDRGEAEMMSKAAQNYRVKIRNIDGTIKELDGCQAIQIELAKVQDNQLFMFTDKKLADRVETHDRKIDELIGKVKTLESIVTELQVRSGSKRNENRIEDLVNMVDVKLERKFGSLCGVVADLGSRVIELEKGKEEPEFTTPRRVNDLMDVCRHEDMTFAFEINGDGLVITAKSNDGKYEMSTSDIPGHLLRDREGIRQHVINIVRKSIASREEMCHGQSEEN